jgi:hypothetical protein
MNARNGKTLVEMLVVITLMSAVLGTAAMTMTLIFRVERQIRRDIDQQVAVERLGRLWRADAHAAIACDAKDDCTFTLADGRSVRYWLDGRRMRREATRGGKVQHREAFALPGDSRATVAVEHVGNRELATLRIESAATHGYGVPVRPLWLTAVVNLHSADNAEEGAP